MRKDQVGGNVPMFHVDINMKQRGISFKNDFTLSFERQNF